MAGTHQHSQVDESRVSPLSRSFSEFGLLADADSAGWGAEEIRSRVECAQRVRRLRRVRHGP